jgi:hypothetical protein
MITIKDNYQLLIEKLDEFIRKFYVNQLIRGGLYSIGLIVLLFLSINLLEYYFYFGPTTRKAMFYGFWVASAVALWRWIALPLLHFYRLGKVISHEQAAQIIGSHFGDVKDKLLNILQLNKQAQTNSAQAELIMASVNQKSNEIKFVPFKSAINLAQNRKYLRYALPPLLLLLVILFAAPSILKDGTKRLINNNTVFSRPAPFNFIVNQDSLTAVQFGDYQLNVKIEGNSVPNEVFIDIDGYQYRLNKDNDNLFSYKFSNVQKETDFKLLGGGIISDEYTLNVLKKPNILGFDIELDYPAYTQRSDENLSNVGDLVVPLGTNINWFFNAQNTDNLKIRFSGSNNWTDVKRSGLQSFNLRKMASTDETYKVFISNAALPNADSVAYSITVIPDAYPNIAVERFIDSANVKMLFFAGDASDDYGLKALTFNYRMKKADGSQGELVTIPIQKPDGKQAQYQHSFDLSQLELKPGEELTYYFEVYDNDAINGSKASKTNPMTYAVPTLEQIDKIQEKNNNEIKNSLEKAIKETKKTQEELKELREKLLQKKEPDWQDKKKLEDLLNKQKEIQKQIEDAKKNFDENKKNDEEFKKPSEEIKEKQEQLEKLFNELQNEEMKKLMDEIEKLMQQMEKEQSLEKMEEMQMNNEELNMELDRMLELFKKLEVEQKMEEQIQKMEEMAKKQEELSKKTEEDQKPKDELKKEQEDIKKEMDKFKEDQKELEKKNEELERKKDMEDLDKDIKETEEDMKESKQEMDDAAGDKKKAAKAQKKAAGKMKNMANKMKMKKKKAAEEEAEEDMKTLRQLLENLVGLSFDQENLMKQTQSTQINTPKYVDLVQQQYKIKNNFQIVEDTLVALSKRQTKLESFITEKVADIKQTTRKGLEQLEERQTGLAGEQQQRTMKSFNDLALMLAESLQQMQQQMGQMMDGDQQCNKPGKKGKGKSGNVPSDKMSEGQKDVNDALQKMKKGMQDGKNPSSQDFAKAAARQSAMRNALRQMDKEKRQQGKGNPELQKAIDEMDKVETDLVNKRLTNETLKRQEDILTRLLEAERADREREYDEKRKAEQSKNYQQASPPSLQEYLKKREAEVELYRTVSPNLKPYYKTLVEDYLKKVKK